MEQSATPWRVFDAPSDTANADAPAAPSATHGASAAPGVHLGAGNRAAIAGIAGAVAIGAIAVLVALSGAGGQVVDAPSGTDRMVPGAALAAAGGELVVDVTGAVTKPGVYHLPPGSRIGDAIDAAGGFSPRVDADGVAAALNLAELLKDGSQVHVPSRDDPAARSAGGGPGGSGGGGGGTGSALVNLNTATQAELEALPGIGPVTATKIIESRTTQPFTAVDELRARKLVGEKTFGQLQALVTVR